jgi:hypothetical protein
VPPANIVPPADIDVHVEEAISQSMHIGYPPNWAGVFRRSLFLSLRLCVFQLRMIFFFKFLSLYRENVRKMLFLLFMIACGLWAVNSWSPACVRIFSYPATHLAPIYNAHVYFAIVHERGFLQQRKVISIVHRNSSFGEGQAHDPEFPSSWKTLSFHTPT